MECLSRWAIRAAVNQMTIMRPRLSYSGFDKGTPCFLAPLSSSALSIVATTKAASKIDDKEDAPQPNSETLEYQAGPSITHYISEPRVITESLLSTIPIGPTKLSVNPSTRRERNYSTN